MIEVFAVAHFGRELLKIFKIPLTQVTVGMAMKIVPSVTKIEIHVRL